MPTPVSPAYAQMYQEEVDAESPITEALKTKIAANLNQAIADSLAFDSRLDFLEARTNLLVASVTLTSNIVVGGQVFYDVYTTPNGKNIEMFFWAWHVFNGFPIFQKPPASGVFPGNSTYPVVGTGGHLNMPVFPNDAPTGNAGYKFTYLGAAATEHLIRIGGPSNSKIQIAPPAAGTYTMDSKLILFYQE